MTLDRRNVTAASRIMLPAYIALSSGFGLVYVLDPLNRLGIVPALTFQRQVLPMWCWGTVFLALAVLMIGALVQRSRMAFAFALACCAITWFLWGCMYGVSVVLDARTSVLAPALPWFVTTACVASMVSLLKGEIQ